MISLPTPFSVVRILAAAPQCEQVHVQANWPKVFYALEQYASASKLVQVAAIATLAVECKFKCVEEHANGDAYEGRTDLGNNTPGDGRRYKGRGFIQLTGRANYEHYGRLCGVDLVSQPEAALDPTTAAQVFALYFKAKGVDKAALAYNWKRTRQLVNGGLNGWPEYIRVVQGLLT